MSLNGRPYMIDTARMEEFTRRSIPLLRNQANTGEQFGEGSLNPEELWRRNQDSWDHGAGQTHYDREDSDRRRFRASKGVDVWTRWQLSLLPDTTSKRASAALNLELMPVGDQLYLTDGASLLRTASLTGTPTWTVVTGTPVTAATSMTSDGFAVFTAHGADGIYRTERGAGTTASHVTGTVALVGYVKGRLMAANGASLYNIIAGGLLPSPLYTQPNSDFRWVGFAEGQAAIYAAGFSGDKSLIYRTAIKQDGTALDVPIIAGELPDGEIVRAVGGYLGFILLGTDKGVRFCAVDSSGNLTVGSLIRTTSPVRCFEGQDKYVWFGWENYDGTSTGLGRLDLSTFIAPLTPAYASDLMVTGQGAVRSVITFGDGRVLAVSGLGVFQQSTDRVSSGTLDTGLISYGLSDPKVAMFLDVRLASTAGENRAYLSADGAAFVLIGTRSGPATSAFQAGEVVGETFEIRQELVRSAADLTSGPVITRQTLRSYPSPASGEIFTVPVLLHEKVVTLADDEHVLDPAHELDLQIRLRQSRALVVMQLGCEAFTVLLDDSVWAPSHPSSDGCGWNGTHILKMKAVA